MAEASEAGGGVVTRAAFQYPLVNRSVDGQPHFLLGHLAAVPFGSRGLHVDSREGAHACVSGARLAAECGAVAVREVGSAGPWRGVIGVRDLRVAGLHQATLGIARHEVVPSHVRGV